MFCNDQNFKSDRDNSQDITYVAPIERNGILRSKSDFKKYASINKRQSKNERRRNIPCNEYQTNIDAADKKTTSFNIIVTK